MTQYKKAHALNKVSSLRCTPIQIVCLNVGLLFGEEVCQHKYAGLDPGVCRLDVCSVPNTVALKSIVQITHSRPKVAAAAKCALNAAKVPCSEVAVMQPRVAT